MSAITGRDGTPVFGIVGWKKSGKTTLTTALVAEFTRRGLGIATVKHAHHDFQIDDAATDSARHRRAGAGQVAIVSRDRWAMVRELAGAPEPHLADVVRWLEPCDLILVEGYKGAPIPKVECRRADAFQSDPLSERDPAIVAIASEQPLVHPRLPVLPLGDVAGIADLILRTVGLARSSRDPAPTHSSLEQE